MTSYLSSPVDYLRKLIEKSTSKLVKKIPSFEIESKKIEQFGDYSSNIAFLLAPFLKQSPLKTAQKIKEEILKNDSWLEKVEIAGGGFLNFFFKKEFWIKALNFFPKIKKAPKSKKKPTVIIEYSSPNIAKPMHVGHFRSTLLGDFLANLYQYLGGWKVLRWNHLGDWGTQFGKLIVAYKKWGDKKKIEKNPISELLALYVKFHQEAKKNKNLEEAARNEFKKLEEGDKENRKLLDWFARESLKEFHQIYKTLGLKEFDVEKGESQYEKENIQTIKLLKKNNLLVESQGALIVDLKEENLPPALIQKSDGTTLYLTREISSLLYRIKKVKNLSRILYVVGSEQSLHFQQLTGILKKLKERGVIKNPPLIEHISFGIVLGANKKKLSTREGRIIKAQDLIKQVIQEARKIVNTKRKELPLKEREKIAQAVGIGALKYGFLKEGRNSTLIFDPQKFLSLIGNSAPYLQYTLVRLKSILKKSSHITKKEKNRWEEVGALELALIRKIISFREVLIKCQKESSSHILTDYLFELAVKINEFYEKIPILKDENLSRKKFRLLLIKKAAFVLEEGLKILGITAIEKI
ncbi:MAG: arginine--tRNA ligase [Candidatus Parcubacteria bacterium]|nr:arginine--tRNA ligase [Patescibacteria group bacterium]BCX16317.1 MAG: arginine--tRNA ligase [Candidatus Parcubacteria bacterium]